MKILLDECVPLPMRRILVGHECQTVAYRGWNGIKNGRLLDLAKPEFQLFITSGQGLKYQQNLQGCTISIFVLSTNKLRPILAAADLLLAAVGTLGPRRSSPAGNPIKSRNRLRS